MAAMRRPLEFPDHPFWNFSLEVYARKGVADACLSLQDDLGIDVNMLLFCCWAGHSGGGELGGRIIADAAGAVASWHDEIVRPLRRLRRRLKGGFAGISEERSLELRRKIQAIEIESEHIEQLFLGETYARAEDAELPADIRAGHAALNVAAYLRVSGGAGTAGHLREIRTLLAATFPDLRGEAVDAALSSAWGKENFLIEQKI
jgi:uncharacterized protein (TIGR02444 family)